MDKGNRMPIYEFYCEDCNTIFNFFSRRINTTAQPLCPSCKVRPIKRQPSTFATIGKAKEPGGDFDLPMDEGKMERAIYELARDAEGVNEDDPRQMARLMRKLSERTGLNLGSGVEEAMARLERGEDPEQVESEMGDIFDAEDLFTMPGKKGGQKGRVAPFRDETLYEL